MWLRRRACQGGDPSQWAAATRAKGRNGRPGLKDVRLPIQQGQNAFPSAFGRGTEPAVIADALKTFGQDVLEKTAQEQEILAKLVLGQRGGIALKMFGQFADISHVLFFSRQAIIFKLDELLELSDRGVVYMHRPGRLLSCERNFPAKPSETMGEKIDDASITAQVKSTLMAHRSTSALKTKVETTDGVVTISGTAKNDAEKSLVTKLVTDVDGVISVVNNMIVSEPEAKN